MHFFRVFINKLYLMWINIDTCLEFLRKRKHKPTVEFITPCGLVVLAMTREIPSFSSETVRRYVLEALGYTPYTRETTVKVERIKTEDVSRKIEIREQVKEKILSRFNNTDIGMLIDYILGELIDNAFEHSRASDIWISGQAFPKDNSFQIAIIDNGVGFLETLKGYKVSTEADALEKALEPGVTGKLFYNNYGGRKNQGFGLFAISQMIGLLEGTMLMVSNNGSVFLKGLFTREIDERRIFLFKSYEKFSLISGSLIVLDLKFEKGDNIYFEDFELLMSTIREAPLNTLICDGQKGRLKTYSPLISDENESKNIEEDWFL